MRLEDTIAAVSTAPGEGGIGIIRVSGKDALTVARSAFSFQKAQDEVRERRMYFGDISDAKGAVIDKGLFVYMKGPASYTGEDVAELHCHGGSLIMKKTLEALVGAGARLAEPGEFTRRAFLNGKLDLAQAEAVIDLIRAQTEGLLGSAQARLGGAFSAKVNTIKEGLLALVTHIEAELDFPEDEIDPLPADVITERIAGVKKAITTLLATYEEGRVIREGVRVLILGRPNVGKSSLLNTLLKEERAIVTPTPGTTRDIIEEVINIKGLPVRLMDTAGLRETADHVESIGVARAKAKIKEAELILFVVDSSAESFEEDLRLIGEAEGKKTMVVANKADLAGGLGPKNVSEMFSGRRIVPVSALRSTGIEELNSAVYEEAVGHPSDIHEVPPGEMVVSLRHKECLEKALDGIDRTEAALEAGLPREMLATDLRWSLDGLGEITGETTTEDILDKIFGEFCIGK